MGSYFGLDVADSIDVSQGGRREVAYLVIKGEQGHLAVTARVQRRAAVGHMKTHSSARTRQPGSGQYRGCIRCRFGW